MTAIPPDWPALLQTVRVCCMPKFCLVDAGLLVTLLLPTVAADCGAPQHLVAADRMAQNTSEPEAVPGRDVLVAGTGAVIDSKSRTRVEIDVGAQPLPAGPKLELLLSPSEVVDEPYLVVVEAGERADAKRLGVVAFYPPPQPGAAQAFYFDASAVIADMKARGTTRADLFLRLAPVERTQILTSSKVRLMGARIVGN
jgi:hypothetical protein